MARAQLQHLVGVIGGRKSEASACATENVFMNSELGQAEALMQAERFSAQSVFQEYAVSCRSLDLAQKQLAHLAHTANAAAISYEHTDAELKRKALHNENTMHSMNVQADLDRIVLERRLQVSYEQCEHVVAKATENQSQAHAKITTILEENRRDKEKMQNEMQEFVTQG